MCIGNLKINDIRDKMPNHAAYKTWRRSLSQDVRGLVIHHSATADPRTGAPIGDALTFFNYHVNTRGWTHGGYHYVLLPDGTVEYALDEKITGYHAGFKDPNDNLALEFGQYWNNHFLAVCLAGYFENGRVYYRDNRPLYIPDEGTIPTHAQLESLMKLAVHLMGKYLFDTSSIFGHRELRGCNTRCPGLNFDLGKFHVALFEFENTQNRDEQERHDCCGECIRRERRVNKPRKSGDDVAQ